MTSRPCLKRKRASNDDTESLLAKVQNEHLRLDLTFKGGPMAKGGKKEPIIVTSKAKAILKKAGCNTAGDAMDGLNGWAYWLLEQAAKRAKANGRKTVRAYDFMS